MIINDNLKKARLTLTNFATSGTIGTAANTIDKVSVFLIPLN